jgi:hypothetical protein
LVIRKEAADPPVLFVCESLFRQEKFAAPIFDPCNDCLRISSRVGEKGQHRVSKAAVESLGYNIMTKQQLRSYKEEAEIEAEIEADCTVKN